MCDPVHQILEVFWWFDDKGKGIISRNELARVLKSLSPDWDDAHVNRLVHLADTKKDGLIKYSEFVAWLMGSSDRLSEVCGQQRADAKGGGHGGSRQASKLEAKRREAEALANTIARDSALAERAEAEANELLEAALPALEAAASALESLRDEDLVALASIAEPAKPLAAVVESLGALRPFGPSMPRRCGWEGARELLTAKNLRGALRDYDKDAVKSDQVEEVRRLLVSASATDDCASVAGRALLLWVRAVVRYFEASRAATPKFQLVNKLHHGMWCAEATLSKINDEVEAMME